MKKSLFTKILGIVILAVGVMTIIFCFCDVFTKTIGGGLLEVSMKFSALDLLVKDMEGIYYVMFGGIFAGIGAMSLFVNNKKDGTQFIVNLVLICVAAAALIVFFTMVGRACAQLGDNGEVTLPW